MSNPFKCLTKKDYIFYLITILSLFSTVILFWKKVDNHFLLIFSSVQAVFGLTGSVLNYRHHIAFTIFASAGALMYALIALTSRNYGEAILNGCYMVPSYVISFIRFFKKDTTTQTESSFKSINMSIRLFFVMISIVVLVTIVYGTILKYLLHSNLPWINAFATGVAICAVYTSANHIREQWYAWVLYSLSCLLLWGLTAGDFTESIPILVQNVLYLYINLTALISIYKKK